MTTCEPLATVTDLFCGGGGASEGMRQAGLEIVQAADMWAPALATHAENHPSAHHLSGDITTYHPKALDTTDMLWASPPCVQFSVARGAYDDSPEADQVRDMVQMADPASQWSLDRVTHRALSVAEVAEIQGFPAGYRLPDKPTTATKILGNSVPPPLSQQIAYWLNHSLKRSS